jgi:predicted site-specific integrase-resolvase
MSEDRLTTGQAAKHLGMHVKTLQQLDRTGKLHASGRTESGRRWYSKADLDAYFGVKPAPRETRCPLAYCRVSSAAQRPDLANQKRVLGEFCAARGLTDVEWVEEIGGGLNFERSRFLALMDRIERREISHLVLAHKDRLTRFGFQWFSRFAKAHGCEVMVLNNETLSPEREMVEDLMTIVHCFSSRLYGLRNCRKSLETALANEGRAIS